jgi:prephenate dehydratase
MNLSIAHLGPPGTYAEQAAVLYGSWLTKIKGLETTLFPYPSIFQTLRAVTQGQVQIAVVPIENSIEGSVTMTMDALWQLDTLQIELALIMPVAHVLISRAQSLEKIKTVYSHPQALAQCQGWLEKFLPSVELVPTNSTTEALQELKQKITAAAISSSRAARIYNLPVLVSGINDYPDNFTRFWIVSQGNISIIKQVSSLKTSHTSLAFSLPANVPGALVKPLQIFAQLGINLSRIESRPTKRSLGEYLFFVDAEADVREARMQSALQQLTAHTEILKIFGSYNVFPVSVLEEEING